MDLKKFRHDFKVSQSELAEIFSCKQGHISNIECGQRSLTALQIRLLIEKFGFDAIVKYAEPGELPQGSTVTVNAPVITDNTAPVQSGNGNHMSTTDGALLELLKQQSEQIRTLMEQSAKKDQQIDRLISILEKK